MTLPELMAVSAGLKCEGPNRCCYCGAGARDPYTLPLSFTTRDTLTLPRSQFICVGCKICLEEAGVAGYPDGEIYRFTKAYRRMLSHVITTSKVTQATKGHIEFLRNTCLNPPAPPFAISIAVSGQKHVLYRGRVCHSRDNITMSLEGQLISYRREDLVKRLGLTSRLVAATGKPALAESVTSSFWFRVCEKYVEGESLCEEWQYVREEPLSQLASFLTPKKEDCERVYPSNRHPGI